MKYNGKYVTDPFTEPQLFEYAHAFPFYFPPIRWSSFAVGQLSGSVQWIFLVLSVTGKSQAAGEGGGRGLESGQQGSTTVSESNLEDQRATSFNKECSSSMSHTPPVDSSSVECVALYAKARNIPPLLWHPQLKPDWLTGLPQTVCKSVHHISHPQNK